MVALLAARTLPAASDDVTVSADGKVMADVIVELTDAGKRIERPTPAHPAYYIPISAGYAPGGQFAFWQREPPTEAKVLSELARELAGQGYLLATHQHPPSLIMVVSWGYIAPRPVTTGAYLLYIGNRSPRPITMPLHAMANATDMLAVTGGAKSLNTWAETDRGAALNEAAIAAGVPRYYTKIIAVDYSDWANHHYTPLWVAHLSVPYWGCYLDEAIPALFKNGAAMFGRDMSAPQMVETSIVPQGRVEVGTAIVASAAAPKGQEEAKDK